ncbi:MAG TPA: response regulator [Gemmatimonadales bacterium]|nr:response regulator [Gemmatimonadales bacterium]
MAVPVDGVLPPDPAPPRGEGPAVRADDEQVGILLVDDQAENLVALEAILEPLGQRLVSAGSGREALRALLTLDPAVILLDVKMPDMDGFETAAIIRERDRSRNIPIIFLTAADRSAELAQRGYEVGAVDYLIKPVVPEFVRSKVSVFVELAKKTNQLTRQAERLRASEQAARELAEARAELVADLEHKNRELESFSYAVSHDLRAPLRRIDSFGRALEETQAARLDEAGTKFVRRIRESAGQMAELIDDLLHLARVTRADLRRQPVDLSALVTHLVAQRQAAEPERRVELVVRPNVEAEGDARLLRIALENLLDNAWKFTAGRDPARIEFGMMRQQGEPAYFVRDDGVGFDMAYAGRLFGPFQRLHSTTEFAGTGIGLATVQRIVHRHGGRTWAEGVVGQGATFWFTLGRAGGRP